MQALARVIMFAIAAGFGAYRILWSAVDHVQEIEPPGPRLPAIRNDVTYGGLGAADWLPVAKVRIESGWEGPKAITQLFNNGGREVLIHVAAEAYPEATERLLIREPDLSEWADAMLPAAERYWRDQRFKAHYAS